MEVCSLRDAATSFEELGVDVYGASMDDVASLAKFVKDQELNFSLLSDPDASATNKYGIRYEGRPFSKRVTFVIDPKGILRHVDEKVSVKTHGEDIVRTVRRLREQR